MSKQAGKLLFLKKIGFDWIFSTKKELKQIWQGYSKKFLAPYNGARAHCQSGRLNILEEVNYNIFLTLTGVWYKSFSQLSFRKFLWIHSGTLQGKLPPSLSPPLAPSLPTPCHQPQRPRPPRPQSLPFGVLWRERTLTTTPSVRDNIFIGDMPLLSTPAQTP